MIDTMPIPPGEKRVEFQDRLDSAGSTMPLTKTVHLNTGSFDVFIPANSEIDAEGRDLEDVGLVGKPEAQFLHC